jgi:hypothetical protein
MFASSAIVGTLTVAATYFATAAYFGRLSGLLAMLLMASSYWAVTISRTGFRAVLIPLFIALFTAFVGYLVRAVHAKKWTRSYVLAALSGIAFAGGFYTYIAYRSMVGVVLGVMILLLLAALHPKIGFPHVKRYGKQFLIAAVAALITILPLAIYFAHHPEALVGRAGQVSVFNPDLQKQFGGGTLVGTITYSTEQTLLSFFAGHGDLNWRQNVAGNPLLNPLVGALFLLGLLWTFRGTWLVAKEIWQGREVHLGMVYPYILLVLLGMLLPVIMTAEGIPHGLRSVGLMVPIFMLAGTAGAVTLRWLKANFKAPWIGVLLGACFGLLVVGAAYDGALYFLMARKDADAYYAYRGDLTDVANTINDYAAAHPTAAKPYLVLDAYSVQTVHFLTHSADVNVAARDEARDDGDTSPQLWLKYRLLDPATSDATHLKPGEIIVFTQSSMPDADRFAKKYGNTVEMQESRLNQWGQEIMRIYKGK